MSTNTLPCPCGSGRPLETCCAQFHGGIPAPSAEALMRSRYSAYALGRGDYLLATWHASTRPVTIQAADPQWLNLRIIAIDAGGAADTSGTVEFVARWLDGERTGCLHETSRFVREGERWLYIDGVLHPVEPPIKVGRNAACPCGSGRKFKHCCG